jgi:hypothetical protein
MVDLNRFRLESLYLWENFINWYLNLPLYGQILIIISAFAIIIASIVLVYYILKGLGYLLYYLFKGIYYLFKGIFSITYKIFKELYYRISGKPRKDEIETKEVAILKKESNQFISHNIQIKENNYKVLYYCTECGYKITESMRKLLFSQGIAYCFKCGKEYKIET